MSEFFPFLSPFIAAGLAAWLTHVLSLKRRRHEVLETERLAAFKRVQDCLLALKSYCLLAQNEIGELSTTDGATLAARHTAEQHISAVRRAIDQNRLFFSRSARRTLDHLITDVTTLAFREIADAAEPDYYDKVLENAENAIDILFSELRFPPR